MWYGRLVEGVKGVISALDTPTCAARLLLQYLEDGAFDEYALHRNPKLAPDGTLVDIELKMLEDR